MVSVPQAVLVGFVVAGVFAAVAEPGRSDSMIASTAEAEVCATDGLPGSAYSRAHRVVKRSGRQGYEHDHIVPLCLGGADNEANLQWQPINEALEKDRLERAACIAVCRNHTVGLTEAQSWFLRDWRKEMWRLGR